jgi:hypothetical protein
MKDVKQTLVGIVITGLGATTGFAANATLGTVIAVVGLVIAIQGALD